MVKKRTVLDIMNMKYNKKIVAVTAYDHTFASLASKSQVDLILVGDSLAQCVQGEDTTLGVTLEEIIYHTKHVVKGAEFPLVVSDLPFMSYQSDVKEGLKNAGRVIKETGSNAVKLEGAFDDRIELIKRCVQAGIPVMGHIGLTPQSVNVFGGYKLQGKSKEEEERIFNEALAIEKAGAFSIVLECIPYLLAKKITNNLKIPVVGIGAGPFCDGQILVINDLLGLSPFEKPPKFIKKFANIGNDISSALTKYRLEVEGEDFPKMENSYK